jgi:hypothetical protein
MNMGDPSATIDQVIPRFARKSQEFSEPKADEFAMTIA